MGLLAHRLSFGHPQTHPRGMTEQIFDRAPFWCNFPPFFGRGRATGTNGPIRLAFQHRYQPRHFLPLYPAHHSHTHGGERESEGKNSLVVHRAPFFGPISPLFLALVDPLVQTPPPLLLRRIDRASLRTLSDVYMLSDVHMCPCTQRCLPPQRCPLAPPPQLGVSESAPRGVCEHRQCSLIFAVSV